MAANFTVDVPDDIEADFKRNFAGEDPDAIMTTLLKRAVLVRRFYDSDEAILAALRDGAIKFSPLRVR
jgi:hypothetical protein